MKTIRSLFVVVFLLTLPLHAQTPTSTVRERYTKYEYLVPMRDGVRPDVLVYKSEPLQEDLTIAGPIKVSLNVSTTGTDSDFVVKVIDVYPGDYPSLMPEDQRQPSNAVKMGAYQQLVHGEPFRAKFRNSLEKPEAMKPGEPTAIRFDMPDVYHCFRRGHRLMVQVQSSWFPIVDRNPQKFLDIPKARPEDFQKATQRVYRSNRLNSSVTVLVEGRRE